MKNIVIRAIYGPQSWRTSPRIIKEYSIKPPPREAGVGFLAYDGSDPTKPIYLALNGTIYDVSANPGTYGPGGSYHFFAGRDAARAFLTGCFMEDQTPDLRGVYMMYMPREPEPGSVQWSFRECAWCQRHRALQDGGALQNEHAAPAIDHRGD